MEVRRVEIRLGFENIKINLGLIELNLAIFF